MSSDGHGHCVVAWVRIPPFYLGHTESVRAQRLSLEQTTSAEPRVSVPYQFALHPAFPNPFNPTTVIRFDLASQSPVELKVYDVTGRLVRTLVSNVMAAGGHTVRFDGGNLASGVYFCRLKAGSFTQTRKLLLLK